MLEGNIFSDTINMLTLKKIVLYNIVKKIWNISFNIHEIVEDGHWELQLTHHREIIIRTLYTIVEENKLPSIFKTILKDGVISLYHAYYQMVCWKFTYDTIHNTIDLSEVGELHVQKYFTRHGEFKELICAKSIVNNSNFDLCQRFYVSCLYCLENESEALWEEVKELDSDHSVWGRIDPLIKIRIKILENNLQEEHFYVGSIWEFGLKRSAQSGYAYATKYFWNKLSEAQRIDIINNADFFELLDTVEFYGQKISIFLYTQLSNDQKQNLLHWMVDYEIPDVWIYLACFWNIETVRSELIAFVCRLPIKMYIEILQLLVNRIEILKLPEDVHIFEILWSKLDSKRKASFKGKMQVIEALVEEKSIKSLENVINSLSSLQKKKFLLNYWHGMNCIDIFCRDKEFEKLNKYFSFFLIKIDPLTQKERLRKDASSLLQQLVESSDFITLCEEELTETEEIKVKNIIETLQISLELLDELCNNVCKEVSTLRFFSSTPINGNSEVKQATEASIKGNSEFMQAAEASIKSKS